jgi:hypothetical protein
MLSAGKERYILKIIRQRLIFLALFSGIGLLSSLKLFVDNFIACGIHMHIFSVLLLLVSCLPVVLLIWEYQIHKHAKLIIENKIMHIEAAKINQISGDTGFNAMGVEGLEVYISCFGILLGSKVIKFNMDGINLKKVEIGNDFIFLVYGKDKKNQSIRLLHKAIEKSELLSIIDLFRHETGITPIVVD